MGRFSRVTLLNSGKEVAVNCEVLCCSHLQDYCSKTFSSIIDHVNNESLYAVLKPLFGLRS